MKIFEGLESIIQPLPESSVAIGTFDGVHVGHQAVIRTAVMDAQANNRPSVVFTFDRHPEELIAPERAPGYLTTPNQRIHLMEKIGADIMVIAHFDRALANLEPESFVRDILKFKLSAKSIVVGRNFYFGHDRKGSTQYLDSIKKEYDFKLNVLDAIDIGGEPASSSRIREDLKAGRIEDAERVLGHPYWLSGIVVEGQRLGRTLGYPTANLETTFGQVVPGDGIYAVEGIVDGERELFGACSIGSRPTVDGAGRSIETYFFDFNEDIYSHRLDLRFHKRLRDELKFDSLDALVRQIDVDVAQAKQLFAHQML